MPRREFREKPLSRFTPLLESGNGLRSRSTDRGRSVYKGVTIIKAGLGNARDRNYYPATTLERAVNDGRFTGLRAYADHPDSVSEEIQPERTIRDMVGVYQNPKYVREGKDGGRVVADLHLFRSAKWLSDTVDDLMEMGQADKIGLSINGRGRTVEKQLTLEESADPVDVNWVEDFITLRSSDVVTEAGAGGGFQHLLESARGTARTKETAAMALTAKQKKSLKEAVDSGDPKKLQAVLKECGIDVVKATKETKGKQKPKGAKDDAADARAAAADAEAADVEEADDEEDDEDHDAALDAAHDEVVEESDDDESDADDSDEEADDEDDVEESDDEEDVEESDDEDDAPARRAAGDGKHKLGGAAAKIRAAATTREAKNSGWPAKGGAGVIAKAKKTRGTRGIKGPGNGETAVHVGKMHSKNQKGGQGGRRFGESQTVERLREENARLSSQLRVRTTADRARNLLRESSIPEKMRPDVLRLMVGKSENEMQRVVRYHERLISTAIEEATSGDYGMSGVEGAGSRVRESYGGGTRGDNSDFSSLLDEVGIPTKD